MSIMHGVYAWSVCMECMHGVYAWSVCMECMHGVYAVCNACATPMHLK